jgi:hypothetical protein
LPFAVFCLDLDFGAWNLLVVWNLEFGVWNLFVVWDLEFGASNLVLGIWCVEFVCCLVFVVCCLVFLVWFLARIISI